jgi:ribonucleotide monophosphatase NagD (HAD superfamily)
MAPIAYDLGERYFSSSIAVDDVPSFAFAFEYVPLFTLSLLISHSALTICDSSIDGVLLRSSGTIPGAAKALAFLHKNKIPYILLTNGGGKHEEARVQELSKKLGVPITEQNFVQSHTPFKNLVEGSATSEALKDKTILVTGGDGDKCRKVAEQ